MTTLACMSLTTKLLALVVLLHLLLLFLNGAPAIGENSIANGKFISFPTPTLQVPTLLLLSTRRVTLLM